MKPTSSLPRISPSRPRTLLLIEDSRAIRQLILGVLLPSALFDVCLQATDGSQGLEMVAAHDVDLILCDLDMPVLDGFAFLDNLRADPRYDAIPVLMLSATDQGRTRAEGLERGASDYIGKPWDPAELRARVQNHLRVKIRQDEREAENRALAQMNRELKARALTLPAIPIPTAREEGPRDKCAPCPCSSRYPSFERLGADSGRDASARMSS